MSDELTLVYFNARGIAENIRFLLALAQVEYNDKRYPVNVVDAKNKIFTHEEFDLDKKNGVFEKSMGKLPYLIVGSGDDAQVISQSKSIERYISKKYRLMGSNLIEEARIDAVCESIRDIKERYDKTGDKVGYLKYEFPIDLQNLVKILDSDTKYAIGNRMSLADVSIYHLIIHYFDDKEIVKSIASSNEKIRNVVVRVASRPEIRVYLTDRVKTPF